MEQKPRKKSPRAPSMAIDEAIERAIKIYDKERRHPAPVEVIAQDIGYKSANNGAALAAIASLRYYGLLERPQDGVLAVAKEVEDYKFSPSDNMKQQLIIKWLREPALFSELLDKYASGLPSEANLKFELIQRGFNPSTADSCISVLQRSVDYARYFEKDNAVSNHLDEASSQKEAPTNERLVVSAAPQNGNDEIMPFGDYDRIPIRLGNGRRAWLQIPSPFYSADKNRIKAQIDLILTDDEQIP